MPFLSFGLSKDFVVHDAGLSSSGQSFSYYPSVLYNDFTINCSLLSSLRPSLISSVKSLFKQIAKSRGEISVLSLMPKLREVYSLLVQYDSAFYQLLYLRLQFRLPSVQLHDLDSLVVIRQVVEGTFKQPKADDLLAQLFYIMSLIKKDPLQFGVAEFEFTETLHATIKSQHSQIITCSVPDKLKPKASTEDVSYRSLVKQYAQTFIGKQCELVHLITFEKSLTTVNFKRGSYAEINNAKLRLKNLLNELESLQATFRSDTGNMKYVTLVYASTVRRKYNQFLASYPDSVSRRQKKMRK